MAVLKGPIDWDIISRLSKDYDFYEEFGRVVVRIYPKHIRQPRTERQRYTWWHFRSAQIWWSHLPKYDRDAWKRLCVGSTWRNRDYYMSLALKVMGNPGWLWMQISREKYTFYPTFLQITFIMNPWRPVMLHYRWDTYPGQPSPVTWTHVGHKIRNNTVLRKWQLSDDLNNLERFPSPGPRPEYYFNMTYPPKWSRIWFRAEWDWMIGPPVLGGWTGLYYIDNPSP